MSPYLFNVLNLPFFYPEPERASIRLLAHVINISYVFWQEPRHQVTSKICKCKIKLSTQIPIRNRGGIIHIQLKNTSTRPIRPITTEIREVARIQILITY